MLIEKNEAQALFTELKGIARRGEELIIQIIQSRAWEPLGYESLAEAWEHEIGNDVVIFSKKIRLSIVREFARTDDLKSLPEIYGMNDWLRRRMIDQYNFGVPFNRLGEATWWGEELEEIYALDSAPEGWSQDSWEYQKERFERGDTTEKWLSRDAQVQHDRKCREVKTRRRAHDVSLPSKPSTLHIEIGEAEYERFTRVTNAAGKFGHSHNDLKRLVSKYLDDLESSLTLSA